MAVDIQIHYCADDGILTQNREVKLKSSVYNLRSGPVESQNFSLENK
jgi:hypothetical protein